MLLSLTQNEWGSVNRQGKSIYHREGNLVAVYCIFAQVHCLCLCVCVCAEGIGGRGSVGRQSWEGHHCLITAMLVTSS